MDFSSDANANFEGLLAVNRGLKTQKCKKRCRKCCRANLETHSMDRENAKNARGCFEPSGCSLLQGFRLCGGDKGAMKTDEVCGRPLDPFGADTPKVGWHSSI